MRAIEQVGKIAPAYAYYFEAYLFNAARKYCNAYNGGKWEDRQIGKHWIAIPPIPGRFRAINTKNFFNGEITALTAGAALTVLSLNHTLWKAYHNGTSEVIVSSLSDLWDEIKDECYKIEDADFDSTDFARFID